MAAGRLLLPSWMPALDSDGSPIPNAKVFFYNNLTTTLAPVYADEALTIPVANPVEANSSGRFPAVWADDAVLYSASVEAPYGPAGVPFTYDNLSASMAADILVAGAAEAAAEEAAQFLADIEAAIQAAQDADGVAAVAGAIAGQAAAEVVVAGKADTDGGNLTAPQATDFREAINAPGTAGEDVNATPFRAALGVNATTFFGNNVPTQGASAAVLYKSDYNPVLTTESLGGLHPTGNVFYRYTYNADFNAANAPTPAPSPAATHMVVATNSGSVCDVMGQMTISLALANNTKALGQNIIVGTPSALNNIKMEGLEIDIQPAPGSTVIDGFGLALNAFSLPMPCNAILIGGVSGGKFANGINIVEGVSGAGLVATNGAPMGSLVNSGTGVYSQDAIILSNQHKLRLSGTASAHAKIWNDGANNLRYVAGSSENHIFRNNADNSSQAVVSNDGFDLQLVGQTYKVSGTTVVRAQQALVADGVNAAAAPTQAEFNALVTQFNLVLARLRTHGLIAT